MNESFLIRTLKNVYSRIKICSWNEIKKDKIIKERYRYLNSLPKTGKIKVAFLVQMAEVWDKELPVYEAMLADERFAPDLIVVPTYDLESKKINLDYSNNYFIEKYKNSIRAYDNNTWIDFSDLRYDYIFYQRPYNWYLPRNLQSYQIAAFARCCYIPYAYWPLENELCGYNRDFYRCMYFAFMESEENAKHIRKLEHDNKRIRFCGYPALDIVLTNGDYSTNTVLWTPRWSYNKQLGGSHFFEYKDHFLQFNNIFPGVELIIRPHPFAFQNYITSGLMTKEEVDEYINSAVVNGIAFDKNAKIEDTFQNVGVLITDVSSIVYTYFLTEKPIIYCSTSVGLSPSFKALMKGMYIANNWDDIVYYYSEILKGNDYLLIERKKIAQKMRDDNANSAKNILDVLAEEIL